MKRADGGKVNYRGGGKIEGPGTSRSDSIDAEIQEGSFVIPASNAHVAEQLREKFLSGSGDKKANLNQGGKVADVKLSNGEHLFTPEETGKLEGMGIDLDLLAPNAKQNGHGLQDGGPVDGEPSILRERASIKSEKDRAEALREQIRREKRINPNLVDTKEIDRMQAEVAKIDNMVATREKKLNTRVDKALRQRAIRQADESIDQLKQQEQELSEQVRAAGTSEEADQLLGQIEEVRKNIQTFESSKPETTIERKGSALKRTGQELFENVRAARKIAFGEETDTDSGELLPPAGGPGAPEPSPFVDSEDRVKNFVEVTGINPTAKKEGSDVSQSVPAPKAPADLSNLPPSGQSDATKRQLDREFVETGDVEPRGPAGNEIKPGILAKIDAPAENIPETQTSPEGEETLFDRAGGLAGAVGAAQTVTGLAALIADGKRPPRS